MRPNSNPLLIDRRFVPTIQILAIAVILLLMTVLFHALRGANQARADSAVKILTVDHSTEQAELLLIAHSAQLITRLLTDDEIRQSELQPTGDLRELRLEPGQFYALRFVEGHIGTTRPNLVRIDIPKQRPQWLRITKIQFLE